MRASLSDPPLWLVAPIMAPFWLLGWVMHRMDDLREWWWSR